MFEDIGHCTLQLKHLHMLLRPPPCCGWEGVDTGYVHFIRALYNAGQYHVAIEWLWTQ